MRGRPHRGPLSWWPTAPLVVAVGPGAQPQSRSRHRAAPLVVAARAGEGGVGDVLCRAGHFVHRVTFCAEGNESRSFSAQSVTLCTKCSPRRPCREGRLRPGLMRWPPVAWSGQGVWGVGSEVGRRGRPPYRVTCWSCDPVGGGAQGVCFRVQAVCRSCGGRRWSLPGGARGVCWWSGAVLHIHPGVLVGPVAWFQRFPVPGDVRGQDECATRAPLHIHPVSVPWFARQIHVTPPFYDRVL